MWWSCARPLPTRALQIHEKITGDTFFDIARRTDGFSGREIEKLMISVQADVYGGEAPELTPELAAPENQSRYFIALGAALRGMGNPS